MKKLLFIFPGALIVFVILLGGCSKKETEQPCDNKGRICITNKLDTVATVQISQLNQIFYLDKDYMVCKSLTGDNPYTFKVSCNTYYLDTTILIQTCDDLQLVLEK